MIAITKRRIAFAVSCLGFAAVLFAGVKDHTGTQPEADPVTPAESARLHPVIIKPGPETPRVLTTQTNYAGQVALASCSSCHTTTTPNRNAASSEKLLKFHQGMTYAHANQSCLNCHNETDYDSLRLANGSLLPYVDVMKLCGQCHGPQLRDYEMGLHGGMNGYWDRTRGPRTRNNCVDCHDPHNPAYPVVQPVLPPKDRIAVPKKAEHGGVKLREDSAAWVCHTLGSPHPGPLPEERGGVLRLMDLRLRSKQSREWFCYQSGNQFSLSPRERAGVRGNSVPTSEQRFAGSSNVVAQNHPLCSERLIIAFYAKGSASFQPRPPALVPSGLTFA